MSRIKDIKTFVIGKAVFCGMDVHKNHWNLCFVCDGEIVQKIRVDVNFTRLQFLLQTTVAVARSSLSMKPASAVFGYIVL